MAVKTKQLDRVFTYGKETLPDPNPNYSVERVMDIYSNQYPELVNAKITGPKIVGNKVEYSFDKNIGTKG